MPLTLWLFQQLADETPGERMRHSAALAMPSEAEHDLARMVARKAKQHAIARPSPPTTTPVGHGDGYGLFVPEFHGRPSNQILVWIDGGSKGA